MKKSDRRVMRVQKTRSGSKGMIHEIEMERYSVCSKQVQERLMVTEGCCDDGGTFMPNGDRSVMAEAWFLFYFYFFLSA